jgi:hypothetical protein
VRATRIASHLSAIQAECAQRHHALRGQQPQNLAEQPAQRLLMPGPEPGDGRVIRLQGGHRVQHDEHQIILGRPLPHIQGHQHRLITLRAKEILRHTP